jgi:hypothetical protein
MDRSPVALRGLSPGGLTLFAIHLICRRQGPSLRNLSQVRGEQNLWVSSCWTISEREAQQLVGGWIYLHPEGKSNRSQFGGVILSFKPCERREGASVLQGLAFTFEARKEGRDQLWRGADHAMAWTGGLVPASLAHEVE